MSCAARCDYITVHADQDAETTNMIGRAAEIAEMKQARAADQRARGVIIDPQAAGMG